MVLEDEPIDPRGREASLPPRAVLSRGGKPRGTDSSDQRAWPRPTGWETGGRPLCGWAPSRGADQAAWSNGSQGGHLVSTPASDRRAAGILKTTARRRRLARTDDPRHADGWRQSASLRHPAPGNVRNITGLRGSTNQRPRMRLPRQTLRERLSPGLPVAAPQANPDLAPPWLPGLTKRCSCWPPLAPPPLRWGTRAWAARRRLASRLANSPARGWGSATRQASAAAAAGRSRLRSRSPPVAAPVAEIAPKTPAATATAVRHAAARSARANAWRWRPFVGRRSNRWNSPPPLRRRG